MAQSQFDLSEELIELMRGVQAITVLTGAGASAESGIPTFRDAQSGLWSRYRPEELASPTAFRNNPRLVWEWYAWRRSLVISARPNPGHLALAWMERHVPRFTLITQNIDGLHQAAGSRNVIELHGNIHRARCITEDKIIPNWDQNSSMPPHCPDCGGLLRPDVVWFGEPLPAGALANAVQASRECDIFISIGTSGLVEPAATLGFEALRAGAVAVEINPEPTPLTVYTRHYLDQPFGLILPALKQAVWPDLHLEG
ncbi:MAG TPA: NAD-dependent deacylase [Anaerolineaceae bacterium]|nr:NAD-dependent deacylase [Anaerolineaceae bacterium]